MKCIGWTKNFIGVCDALFGWLDKYAKSYMWVDCDWCQALNYIRLIITASIEYG